MWTLAQVFNPAYAASHLSPHGVDALSDIKPLHYHKLIDGMKREGKLFLALVPLFHRCLAGGWAHP